MLWQFYSGRADDELPTSLTRSLSHSCMIINLIFFLSVCNSLPCVWEHYVDESNISHQGKHTYNVQLVNRKEVLLCQFCRCRNYYPLLLHFHIFLIRLERHLNFFFLALFAFNLYANCFLQYYVILFHSSVFLQVAMYYTRTALAYRQTIVM